MDQKEYNRQLIEDFRAERGKPGGVLAPGSPFASRPLLLLTTTGAKSGQPHTAPMMYVRDGNRLLVIASNAGAPKHPGWYHNLVAHPGVTVEVGNETYKATAIVTEGAERERLWNSIIAQYPFFTEHQAKIARQIPIVALERSEDP
ncbi:MAG TPA: nitroreductase family deazaflavin-dependent oxidoreductase [Ktedonobacteraceae bacterium]|nr:nitroreductase family deazaflavin-dependent oxidoreductase [Ktedonobacteraceae bacterium]